MEMVGMSAALLEAHTEGCMQLITPGPDCLLNFDILPEWWDKDPISAKLKWSKQTWLTAMSTEIEIHSFKSKYM